MRYFKYPARVVAEINKINVRSNIKGLLICGIV